MHEIKRMSNNLLNKQDFLLDEKRLNHPTPIHWHEFYEIEYFISGHGTAIINQKPYEIHPGTLLFLTPTDFEEIPDWDEGQLINLAFSDTHLYPEVMTALSSCAMLSDYPPHLLLQLQRELQKQDEWSVQVVRHLLNCLAIDIIRQIPDKNTAESAYNQTIRQAVRYIKVHFREPLTLRDVSYHVGLSPNYFSSLFRQEMGTTFKAYLTNQRLKYAGRALTLSESSISDICFTSGFNDFSSFSRAFRKHYNKSPSEYRLEKTGI